MITKMSLWLFRSYLRVAIFLLTVGFALLIIFQVYSSHFQQFQSNEGDFLKEDSHQARFDIRSPGSHYNERDVHPFSSLIRHVHPHSSLIRDVHPHSSLIPDVHPPSSLIPDTPKRIIYNRVPKSGSTTTRTLIKRLSVMRNFTFYGSKLYRNYLLEAIQTRELTESLYKMPTPLVYDRHVNYVDFSKFARDPPLYINLVRDPTKTFVSRYYFDRFQTGNQYLFKSTKHMTLHSCLHDEHVQCDGASLVLMSNFFCGQEEICNTESPEALQLAKANLDKYLVVGVLDRYTDFLHVLECLLPRYFNGVKKMYQSFNSKKKNQTHKKPETDADLALLTKRLHKQYDIYHYIEQKFDELYKKVIQICPA